MAQFIANTAVDVAVGSNVLFTDTVVPPCPCVRHREGSGIFTLRGGHKYLVAFSANVAGAAADTEVTLALALGGEELIGARMASTPSAADAYNNVATFAEIVVPCGCCYTLSVENIGLVPISVATANLIIFREE